VDNELKRQKGKHSEEMSFFGNFFDPFYGMGGGFPRGFFSDRFGGGVPSGMSGGFGVPCDVCGTSTLNAPTTGTELLPLPSMDFGLGGGNWGPFGGGTVLDQTFMPDVNPDGSSVIPIRAHYPPTADVHEAENEYTIMVQLPGVSKENLKVNASGNNLTISGERPLPSYVKNDKLQRRARRGYGRFSRTLVLPADAELNKINAKHDLGVLEICIQKRGGSRATGTMQNISIA
jgi:HSP20 family molecular chaperone IbpA